MITRRTFAIFLASLPMSLSPAFGATSSQVKPADLFGSWRCIDVDRFQRDRLGGLVGAVLNLKENGKFKWNSPVSITFYSKRWRGQWTIRQDGPVLVLSNLLSSEVRALVSNDADTGRLTLGFYHFYGIDLYSPDVLVFEKVS